MARPFASLDKVIVSLHVTPGQTVLDLAADTSLSVVQIRRAVWAGRDDGLIRLAKSQGTSSGRDYLRYQLSEAGVERVEAAAAAIANRAALARAG